MAEPVVISAEAVEPVPTFGPRAYRRIADGVTFATAVGVAEAQGYFHVRTLPVGGRSGKSS
jgi:hypothetical protein